MVRSCGSCPVISPANGEENDVERTCHTVAPMDWGKCGTYGERKKAPTEGQQTWRIIKLEFADHHSHYHITESTFCSTKFGGRYTLPPFGVQACSVLTLSISVAPVCSVANDVLLGSLANHIIIVCVDRGRGRISINAFIRSSAGRDYRVNRSNDMLAAVNMV